MEHIIEEMLQLANHQGGDLEHDHIEADELLLSAVRCLGYKCGIDVSKFIEAYEYIDKWYA
jgi:hypothetical protein